MILFLLFFDCRLPTFVISEKSLILQIFEPFFNVESKRNSREWILRNKLIVLFEIIE